MWSILFFVKSKTTFDYFYFKYFSTFQRVIRADQQSLEERRNALNRQDSLKGEKKKKKHKEKEKKEKRRKQHFDDCSRHATEMSQ